jgi:hypothetical protein
MPDAQDHPSIRSAVCSTGLDRAESFYPTLKEVR